MCVNCDIRVWFRQITVPAMCIVVLRKEAGYLLFEDARRGLAGLRTRDLTLLARGLRWLSTRSQPFMEEVLEKNFKGWCIGAETANMELQQGDNEEIPADPSNIVSPKVNLPAVVGTHSAECGYPVPNGENAKERDLLSYWDAQIPIKEGWQDCGDQVLDRGYNAGGENVGSFVETAIFVTAEQELSIGLIPECGDGVTPKYGHKCESDGRRSDESNRDPRGPAKTIGDNTRG